MKRLLPRRIRAATEQFILSLLQRRSGCYLLKICLHIVFLFRDRFKNEGVPLNMDVCLGDLPDMGREFTPFHVERTASLEFAQKPISNLDVADQASF